MAAEEFVDIVPGTEVMKDHDGIHFIHARNAAQGPVLLPTPSEHAHDPLVRVFAPLPLLYANQPLELEPVLENSHRYQPGHLRAHQRRD